MMLFRDVVTLLSKSKEPDRAGYVDPGEVRAEVFADVRSVKRSEFYIGHQAGMRLAKAFIVRACDYAGQAAVEHDGTRYQVQRAYSKDGELMELNCSEEGK